eukprot:COSAG01_NODE_1880_length_8993_cov_60.775916_1_plen_59_part_10
MFTPLRGKLFPYHNLVSCRLLWRTICEDTTNGCLFPVKIGKDTTVILIISGVAITAHLS